MARLTNLGLWLVLVLTLVCMSGGVSLAERLKTDTVPTSKGELTIHAVGHGSLYFEFDGKVIHVDPWGKLADYAALPKADLILITHHHRDHLDAEAIVAVAKPDTLILASAICVEKLGKGKVLKNGEAVTELEIPIEVVAAYNLQHTRSSGEPYHVRGEGNGYVLTFGDKRIYVAGDTENTPEMKSLTGLHAAFLPMNLPYTMTPEMVADAARAMKPAIVYPYHFDKSDTGRLAELLKDTPGVEVRVMTFGR